MKKTLRLFGATLLFAGLSTFSSLSAAEYDYTPGFDPGPAPQMAPLKAMVGDWQIDIFYPVADPSAENGWRWAPAGTTKSTITSSLGGVSITDHFDGVPTGGANGAEGYDLWSYVTTMTWDRGANTYRFGIVDNIWGLLDIYVGNMSATGGDVSNLETSTWGFGGAEGARQKNRIVYSDMETDQFTVDWYVIGEASINPDLSRDQQSWSPSVRLIYKRTTGTE